MKIALIYGYAEGPRIAAKFHTALTSCGHQLVQPDEAEVIIAHSGGSYMIPENNKAKVIISVDVPYYDSHWSFMKKLTRRVVLEGFGTTALRKLVWNVWYVVSRPKRSLTMKKAVIDGKFVNLDQAKVILLRNKQDNFGELAEDKVVAKANNWSVISLPGTHDDLWVNPEPYIKLMEKQL